MKYQFKIAGFHFKDLKQHLFPGDGNEAIAIALCGRFNNGRVAMLLVHKLLLIPHKDCVRKPDFIEWPTEPVVPFLEEAMRKGMAIVKIHSHPGWYRQFSYIDDESDSEFFNSVYGWTEGSEPHGSVVMLPDGSMFGRVILPDGEFAEISKITIAGDQILSWPIPPHAEVSASGLRTAQLFGEGTYSALRHLKIGIVGVSGTGSPVVEQLYRYQVGMLVIVDGDPTEFKNLNRIINARARHAAGGALKVDVMEEAIKETGLGTKVISFGKNLYDSREAVSELATCDVVIGCMDTAEGRDLLNRLATFYLVPYIDMGIAIDSDGKGGINKIEASVHYLQPGKSSLRTRGMYAPNDVVAESIFRKNKTEYDRLIEEGERTGHKYIHDVNVERPAVIGLNMQVASTAINELLNRIHPYKISRLEETAKIAIDITDNFMIAEKESDFDVDSYLLKRVGRGDTNPLLECADLSVIPGVII